MLTKLVDHHVHTEFSPDSKAQMAKLIKRARYLGLQGVMFTDHVDFDSPVPTFKKPINYKAYGEAVKTFRKDNPDMEIMVGVEIGYQSHLGHRLTNFIRNYPFQFVICSLHCCDGVDFFNGDFFREKSPQVAYEEYFQAVARSIKKFTDFDVFGHLDHIVRCSPYPLKEIRYRDYQELIDEILKDLIYKGKGIELNTSGLRSSLKVTYPSLDILKAYRNLGGEIITLGSDAHKNEELQGNFLDAIKLLRESGFRAITQFKERKPIFLDI